MRRILRFGWVRSTVAALTLVGVAVVFLVVILPTAFGSAKSAKGGCKIKFKYFSTDKALRADEGDAEASYVAIFGSNLDQVDVVQFGGPAGKQWINASSFTFVQPGGYLIVQPDPDSLGVKGRIRIIDEDPNPDCYSTSSSEFTPIHAS